jgi:transcriptional regulator
VQSARLRGSLPRSSRITPRAADEQRALNVRAFDVRIQRPHSTFSFHICVPRLAPADPARLTSHVRDPYSLVARLQEKRMPPKSDLLQGTLDLLVLKTLAEGAMHGWGISLKIQALSQEVLQVNQGSLYPALHRLEEQGLVDAEWGSSENNRQAKFYQLTRAGRKQLTEETRNWERISAAVARVLAG